MLDGGGAAYFDEFCAFGANAFPHHGDFASREKEKEATNSGPNAQPSTAACRSNLSQLPPGRPWAENPRRWEGNSQVAPVGRHATANGVGKRRWQTGLLSFLDWLWSLRTYG